MFLIAKIVRGRRLLHELEQEEKEKAKEKEKEREREREKEALALQLEQQQSTAAAAKRDSSGQGVPPTSAGIRRSRFTSVRKSGSGSASATLSPTNTLEEANEKENKFTTIKENPPNAGIQRRKRTVRQKTDSSLPENTNNDTGATQLETVTTAGGACMRRTSSMPLVGVDVNTGQRLRHYNYDVKLSKLQKRALRFTWHRLHTRNGGKRVENVFEEVFERLLKTMPFLRDMFTTRIFLSAISKSSGDQPAGVTANPLCSSSAATLRDHSKLIVKMVDTVIKNLDTEEKRRTDTGGDFDPIRLGRAHANLRPYGFVSALWEKMGETIIDVVLGQEAVRDLPGAGQAWVVLTACLVDQLRAGFETSRELQQRQSPNTPVVPGCPISQQKLQKQPQNQQQDHQQEYEAASLAAQKLLLMRSHIQQRNQQEDQNYPQNSTSSPPKPRHSLCNCHLGEMADFNIYSGHPTSHLAHNHLVHRQESSQHSVGSSPSYSPAGSSQCLNQSQQQAHRASWCPSGHRSGTTPQCIHLPARPSPSNPERDARRRSGSTISSSSISKLSTRNVQMSDMDGGTECSTGSRRNSSGEVLLLSSNLCRNGPGNGGRHSHHGSSNNSSRKSTPDRAVVMDRMGGRTVEVGMEGGRGSARGSQGSINRPATPSNGIMG